MFPSGRRDLLSFSILPVWAVPGGLKAEQELKMHQKQKGEKKLFYLD